MTANASRTARAFTLIEAMMAVVLLSMITLFAVPMYREAVARSYRLLVIDHLRETAWERAWQTRGVTDGSADASFAENGLREGDRHQAARDTRVTGAGLQGVYRVVATYDERGMPWVRASPVAGGPMQNDACATYLLGSNGVRKSIDAAGRRMPVAREQACWHGRG